MADAKTTAAKGADKRMVILSAAIKKVQARPDALIEILHKAQELFGYLEDSILWHVARHLKLPPSRVYGVATFYHLFRLKPPGQHTCVVCAGTACFVKGAHQLVSAVEQACGVVPGQTTADGKLSVLTARCVGACGLAPVAVMDGVIAGSMTAKQLVARIKGWQADGCP